MSGINWQEVAVEVAKDKEIKELVKEIERLKNALKKCRESREGGCSDGDVCDV